MDIPIGLLDIFAIHVCLEKIAHRVTKSASVKSATGAKTDDAIYDTVTVNLITVKSANIVILSQAQKKFICVMKLKSKSTVSLKTKIDVVKDVSGAHNDNAVEEQVTQISMIV